MPWLEEAENLINKYKLEDAPTDQKTVLECVSDDIAMLKK